MEEKKSVNRRINILNLCISILVIGTGLILFFQFHIDDGGHREAWLGLGKGFWLFIHQMMALGFLFGLALHVCMHWRYIETIARRWRRNLPRKIKLRTREQILLSIAALIVLWAGFYPWAAMPEATLEMDAYHGWIDIHNRVGIFYVIGLAVHILRRWRRFGLTPKNCEAKA